MMMPPRGVGVENPRGGSSSGQGLPPGTKISKLNKQNQMEGLLQHTENQPTANYRTLDQAALQNSNVLQPLTGA